MSEDDGDKTAAACDESADAVGPLNDDEDDWERIPLWKRVGLVVGWTLRDLLARVSLTKRFAISAGLVLGAVVVSAWYYRHTWKFGDFPTWVATIAAITAAIFAALVYRREERRDARRDLERRQEQASKVASWMDLPPGSAYVHAHLRNASEVPVYDVRVMIHVVNRAQYYAPQDYSPAFRWEVPVLPPGAEPKQIQLPDLAPFQTPDRYATSMTFRDASGIYWMRSVLGELFEDRDPHPWLYETDDYKPLN